jgi:hypothetical protein
MFSRPGPRYYSPQVGRFWTRDPVRVELNQYRYVAGNPVNRVDPSGMLIFIPPTMPSWPPEPILWPVCAWHVFQQCGAWSDVSTTSDKFRHCACGCLLKSECAVSKTLCYALAEIWELLGGRHADNPQDIAATRRGCDAGAGGDGPCPPTPLSCMKACKVHYPK